MKTKLSKILLTIMFTLLVFAGGGVFGACANSEAKVNSKTPTEPSVVYADVLPLEVDGETLLKYTGEKNAVIDIPSSYDIDQNGNIVAGDTYKITKIADGAFKNVEFYDAYIDMSNVTVVGESAFENVKNITISEMPSLKKVNDRAFYKATANFENFNLSSVEKFGKYAFAENKSYNISTDSVLEKVHANDYTEPEAGTLTLCANNGITVLSGNAFSGNTNITNLVVGDGICYFYDSTDSEGTFSGCTNLEKAIFGKGNYVLSKYMFQSSGLKQVDMQNAMVEAIPYYCFVNCANLVAVNLPNTIKTYDTNPFLQCPKLKNINRKTTPYSAGSQDGHTSISGDAGRINFCFPTTAYCSITEFVIPQTVTSVEMGAFAGFNKLQSMALPFIGRNITDATNEDHGYGSFGYIFGENEYNGATATVQFKDKTWYIPDSLTTINLILNRDSTMAGAFKNMKHLTTVSIVNGAVNCTYMVGSTFSGCTNLADLTFPDTIETFGESVFRNCKKLTNITIPEGTTHIDQGCFYGCTNLVAVNLPKTVVGQNLNDTAMFTGCTGLTKITRNATEATSGGVINFQFASTTNNTVTTSFRIPASITTIDDYAFKNWTVLQYLNLCDGGVVESFGIDACRGCSALVKVTFSPSLKTLGNNCFYGCSQLGNHSERTYLTFSSGLTTIGTNCFNGCSSLQAVNLPSTLTTLGSGAFTGCTLLTSWTRYATAQTSGGVINFQFSTSTACALSGELYISGPVTTLGAYCFQNFTSITSVTIPSGIATFGNYVFRGCTSLTSATFASGRTTISAADMFYNCSALSSVTFPSSGLTSISGAYMFGYCSSLATVTIPTTVTTLGGYLFGYCTGLQYITIPSSVTTISDDCSFYYCSNLVAVNLPGTISSGLGYLNIFTGCSKLTKTCKYSTPQTIGGYINFMTTNTSATSVYLNDYVTEIGESTFDGWTSLRSVHNVSNVEYIGDYAFYNCTSLYSSWISNMTKLKEIGNNYGCSFYNCYSTSFTSITLPSGFKCLRRYSFRYCSYLTALNIPSSIEIVSYDALTDCTGLTEYTRNSTAVAAGSGLLNFNFSQSTTCYATEIGIPNSCTYYRSTSSSSSTPFANFRSLATLRIPSPAIDIPSNAYIQSNIPLGALFQTLNPSSTYYNSVSQNGTTYYFPKSLKCVYLFSQSSSYRSVNDYCFQNMSQLNELYCYDFTSIGTGAFQSCTGISGTYNLNEVLKIGIVTIGAYAFSGCTGLTSVTIPNTVTVLYNDVFTGCNNITTVTFESTSRVAYIGNGCFNGCSKLSSITLPSSLTMLGNHVFYGCSGLSGTFTIPSVCRAIGQYCFVGTSLGEIVFSMPVGWYTATSGTGDWLTYASGGLSLISVTVINSSTNATNLRTNGSWSTLWMTRS